MPDWLASTKTILSSVFDEYAVRLAVFLISWPLIHAFLQLPLFGFLSALNIQVVTGYFIQATALLSTGVALWLQKGFYSWLVGRKKREDTRKRNEQIVGDLQPNEAAFLCGLYQERLIRTLR